jgi:urease accessory protein
MNAGLMMLVDGRFPAGGHTNSAGVESAVRAGDVHDDASLERYLRGRLATTGVVDAAFAAHTAGCATEEFDLAAVDLEYSARIMSPALRDASRRFGRQMLRAGRVVWTSPLLDALSRVDGGAHQPVVLGALVAAAGGSATHAAETSMHHLSAAVCTAAVRLLGLDPMRVAATQLRVGLDADRWIEPAPHWAQVGLADLPASGGSLTEILGEQHAHSDTRLFVA